MKGFAQFITNESSREKKNSYFSYLQSAACSLPESILRSLPLRNEVNSSIPDHPGVFVTHLPEPRADSWPFYHYRPAPSLAIYGIKIPISKMHQKDETLRHSSDQPITLTGDVTETQSRLISPLPISRHIVSLGSAQNPSSSMASSANSIDSPCSSASHAEAISALMSEDQPTEAANSTSGTQAMLAPPTTTSMLTSPGSHIHSIMCFSNVSSKALQPQSAPPGHPPSLPLPPPPPPPQYPPKYSTSHNRNLRPPPPPPPPPP